MIALAIFFVFIIGLLLVNVWLLKKYFEMYSNIYIPESNEDLKAKKFKELRKMTNILSLYNLQRKILPIST